VKTAQELARHSTRVLIIGRYAHARLHDLTGALEGLPDLSPPVSGPKAQRATGTDFILPANRQQLAGVTGQNVPKPHTPEMTTPTVAKYLCWRHLATTWRKRRRPDSNRGITDLQSAALATWLRRPKLMTTVTRYDSRSSAHGPSHRPSVNRRYLGTHGPTCADSTRVLSWEKGQSEEKRCQVPLSSNPIDPAGVASHRPGSHSARSVGRRTPKKNLPGTSQGFHHAARTRPSHGVPMRYVPRHLRPCLAA
jgi:hypothetical protein